MALDEDMQREFGKLLYTFAASFAAIIVAYMLAIPTMQAKIEEIDRRTSMMPPIDYRELQNERIESIRKDLEAHKRDNAEWQRQHLQRIGH